MKIVSLNESFAFEDAKYVDHVKYNAIKLSLCITHLLPIFKFDTYNMLINERLQKSISVFDPEVCYRQLVSLIKHENYYHVTNSMKLSEKSMLCVCAYSGDANDICFGIITHNSTIFAIVFIFLISILQIANLVHQKGILAFSRYTDFMFKLLNLGCEGAKYIAILLKVSSNNMPFKFSSHSPRGVI